MSENPAYADFKIGRYSYGYPDVVRWNDETRLEMGSFCSIAPKVSILLGGEHHPNWLTTYPFSAHVPGCRKMPANLRSKGDVIIGNDVWIGYGATVLSGVRIGDGAIVGAGALVTKDVAPYSIVGGNPARRIRDRFPADMVASLLELKWWDRPLDEIRSMLPTLLSERYDEVARWSGKSAVLGSRT